MSPPSENLKFHICSDLSGSFSTSAITNVPRNKEMTIGKMKTKKAELLMNSSFLPSRIPLYLFSNDQIVQDNYVAKLKHLISTTD